MSKQVASLEKTSQDVLNGGSSMKLAIPLDEMTTAEKMQAIEEIWTDLQRAHEELPSPAWHADLLAAREERVREGASRFSDWATAESEICEKG